MWGAPAELLGVGDDAVNFRLLDGRTVRSIAPEPGNPITMRILNDTIYIGCPLRITGFGDGATNGLNLLNGSVIRSLKGGRYVRLRYEGNSIVVEANDSLVNDLAAKQDRLTVYGSSTPATGFPLLENGVLKSIGDSSTITVFQMDNKLYFKTALNVDDISGLSTALDGKQATLTALGDAASFRLLAGSGVKALKAGGYVSLSQTASDVTVATNAALDTALAARAPLNSPSFTGTVTGITKAMVGLGSVDNTSDLAKPISTATQAALNLRAPLAGPSFTGAVSFANASSVTGLTRTGSGGVVSIVDAGLNNFLSFQLSFRAPLESPTFTGTVSGITKSMVGLGNVDNTSDLAKPVSTATQAALNLRAPLASPSFTGTVTGITKAMVGLGNADDTSDASKPISTATQAALDAKAPLASPSFTGTLTVNGEELVQANQHAVQMTLSGGGTVTWTGSFLRWTDRILALPSERTELATEGFHEIRCPTSGTIQIFNDPAITATTVTCTSDGIPMPIFTALYYEITSSRPSDQTRFRLVNYNNVTWSPTGNWLLVAVHNGDYGLKWAAGLVHIPRSTLPAVYDTNTGQCSWAPSRFWITQFDTTATRFYQLGTLTLPQNGFQAHVRLYAGQMYNISTGINQPPTQPQNYVCDIYIYSSDGTSQPVTGNTSGQASTGCYHHGFATRSSVNTSPTGIFLVPDIAAPTTTLSVWVGSTIFWGNPICSVTTNGVWANSQIKSAALPTTGWVELPIRTVSIGPWVAGRFGNAGVIGSSGQQSFTITRPTTGQIAGTYNVNWTTPHPSGSNYGVLVTGRGPVTVTYGIPTSTSFQVYCYGVGTSTFTDLPQDATFMMIP